MTSCREELVIWHLVLVARTKTRLRRYVVPGQFIFPLKPVMFDGLSEDLSEVTFRGYGDYAIDCIQARDYVHLSVTRSKG